MAELSGCHRDYPRCVMPKVFAVWPFAGSLPISALLSYLPSASTVIFLNWQSDHFPPLLKALQWLPGDIRTSQFCMPSGKALCDLVPVYLTALLSTFPPNCPISFFLTPDPTPHSYAFPGASACPLSLEFSSWALQIVGSFLSHRVSGFNGLFSERPSLIPPNIQLHPVTIPSPSSIVLLAFTTTYNDPMYSCVSLTNG